ncbi:MAG: GTP 3',8-cyclase MoaA [Duodenibacillus sp.]|nr:GTP 3',8-cyclase MoaA [Duodenibacillus sp.]HBC70053.1 GTP 3',8-cyclase MoaA [Sutterella sp.]
MSRTVPIEDVARRSARSEVLALPIPISGQVLTDEAGSLVDTRGRPLTDLRISVTDHCNFRCRYCMPKEKYGTRVKYLTHTELLSFEEIFRLSRLFVELGVRKIRLTGGEPLLRKHLDQLIARIKSLRTRQGAPVEVALTTNAALLARFAPALKAAGLDRVTVSLDALSEELFQSINDVGFPAARVLEGIHAARAAGLPVKVNTVLKRGMNEGEIIPLAEAFRGTGIALRFIEYMDAGTANDWRMHDVIPSSEAAAVIHAKYPLEPVDPAYRGETASRMRYLDGQGEVGFISSVTQAFCRDCTRVRLSVEGGLFLCLFADRGYDIRTMLRGGATDEEIKLAVGRIWSRRADHYSEIRLEGTQRGRARIEMQYIGG